MKKLIFTCSLMLVLCTCAACSNGGSNAVQTRNDLTRDHFSGFSSGMKRSDVTDLIGENDEALASKEDFDVYSLSDGSTAILRYTDDQLQSVYIRDSSNYEDSIFNAYERPSLDIENNNTDENSGITTDTNNNTGNDAGNDAVNDSTAGNTNSTNNETSDSNSLTNDNTHNAESNGTGNIDETNTMNGIGESETVLNQ